MSSYTDKEDELIQRVIFLPDGLQNDFAADTLDRMNWSPELLVGIEDFQRISRKTLLHEVKRFLSFDDEQTLDAIGPTTMSPERARLTQASLLVNAGELLWKLREDDLDAWDHVNELYEDD